MSATETRTWLLAGFGALCLASPELLEGLALDEAVKGGAMLAGVGVGLAAVAIALYRLGRTRRD